MTTPKVLFLAGLGRSGSTLVERTLAEVPGLTALGEVMHLWDRGLVRDELCACGERFGRCAFWREVGERAFDGWSTVDAERMAWLKGRVDRTLNIPRIAWGHGVNARLVEEYADHFVRLYTAVVEMTGDVLVDSSKQASLAWCLSRVGGLDLRVVHCVRDSRGVGHSWGKTVRRPETVSEENALMPRYSPATVAAHWSLHNAASEVLRRRVPVERLRYEDFVADPLTATRRLVGFAGVDSSELSHIHGRRITLGDSHSCAGNPMRFTTGQIEVVADDAWRSADGRGRRTLTALTAPLLARYGYR